MDTSGLDAAAFARSVAETPDDQLEAGMRSESRRAILDEIFRRMERHFRGGAARDLDAVVHWKILDRPDGGYDHYELVVRDGACAVSEQPAREPTVTLRVKPVDFLKLVTGNASGPVLFLQGRLGIDGDVMLASRLPGLFAIPRG